MIEPEIVKKVKTSESNLKTYVKNKETRKVLEVISIIINFRQEEQQHCFQYNNNVLKQFIMEKI